MTPLSNIRDALTRQGADRPAVVAAKVWAFAWIVVMGALVFVAIGVAAGAIR